MFGNCFNSNIGSPVDEGGPPRVSIGKLCLSRGRYSKKILSISFLSCICKSFSLSSKYYSKGSVGGTAIEARPIISSLLGNSSSRCCLLNLEKLNS